MPKIFTSYKDFVQQPDIQTSNNAFKISLPNQNEQLKSSQFPSSENHILNLLVRLGKIKRKDVEIELGISQTMAGRLLKSMVDKQIIMSVGQGKNTAYVLKK